VEKTSTELPQLSRNQLLVTVGDERHTVTILEDGKIDVDGRTYSFSFNSLGPNSHFLLLNNRPFRVSMSEEDYTVGYKPFEIKVNNTPYEGKIEDYRSLLKRSMLTERSASSTGQKVTAPMPGKVVRIEVAEGDTIKAGTGLIVLEAMKMENEIKSGASGSVTKIHVSVGKAVEKGEILISIAGVEVTLGKEE
jgi:biotin carboxyl carrier protein